MKKKKNKVILHRKYNHKKRTSKAIIVPAVIIKTEVPNLFGPISKPRRKKRGMGNIYFDQSTEDAIILYNNTENLEIREDIFNNKILYSFKKLIENILNTFKFSYFETGPQDVQKECLTHLVANMHKFDPTRRSKTNPEKKTKAYSYFSIIAKHYLILLNNTNYKKFKQNIEISEERNENTVQLQQDDKYYAQKEMSEFIKLIVEFWEKNVNKIFTKQRDLNIANAVIEIIRRGENISLFNKKALYLYIREIANCHTQQITKVINKMKPIYSKIRQSYVADGKLPVEILDTVGIK